MKLSTLALLAASCTGASAFQPQQNGARSFTSLQMTQSLNLANQLAVANAEKAASIRAAEAKNQAEIEALKLQISQIEDLFNSSPTSSTASAGNGLQNYLGNLLQKSDANQKAYKELTGGTGPGLSQVLATSVAAGTFGGLVTTALDSNRRDSIAGIVAGVAGSAASLAGGSSTSTTAAPAAPAYVDPAAASVINRVLAAFPGAQSNAELVEKVGKALKKYGYGPNSLLATSFCCDEVNRPLEDDLSKAYGSPFNMGGLAGFPFGGVTSFAAMAKHIPDGGSCLVVYGPHVGVDLNGKVGTVNRRGKEKGGTCCGSAVAASQYVSAVAKGEVQEAKAPTQSIDAQQLYVGSVLLPYAERLSKAADPMIELPYAMFEPVDDLTQKIVDKASSKVGGNGKIALLGGVQINTPDGVSDYFLPLRFEVRDNKNNSVENLLFEKRF
eukprot:CAMPEP_0168766108 /NCGR_PEP_ID=MMETSP0725-20121227/668_1 /TAXON_ID=265536 /ORGANISM="Amphiprora sp., Strain CCMP467" /LENGTH=440 /DNA_ID=CAMNT_0008815379 /DNA_START=22 /DNA_END=1344 /DNA_ORIENTATION=+